MENGKKIAIVSIIVGIFLVIGGFFLFSEKKTVQYGYKLTEQTGGITGVNETSVVTGTIVSPTPGEALAYINTWNGDVKRDQK